MDPYLRSSDNPSYDGGSDDYSDTLKKGATTLYAANTVNWEKVAGNLERISVPGGWLYRDWSKNETLTFVPTPTYTAATAGPGPHAITGWGVPNP